MAGATLKAHRQQPVLLDGATGKQAGAVYASQSGTRFFCQKILYRFFLLSLHDSDAPLEEIILLRQIGTRQHHLVNLAGTIHQTRLTRIAINPLNDGIF